MFHSTYENERTALVEYIKINQQKFYRLAYSYAKNRENALDIVQESVVKALSNVHTIKEISYIKTWFYRILINESLGCLRKNKKNPIYNSEYTEIAYEDKDLPESIDLYRAIEKLHPKLRTVVVLRYYEDMKLDEIAQITQSNPSTVKSRLYKGLNELKVLIEEV